MKFLSVAVQGFSGQPRLEGLEERYPNRPPHCTRRRVKPFIDGCGCEWCERIDGDWEAALRSRDRTEKPDTGGSDEVP